MNVCEAVILVLKKSGEVLHVNEITKRILSRRLCNFRKNTGCDSRH